MPVILLAQHTKLRVGVQTFSSLEPSVHSCTNFMSCNIKAISFWLKNEYNWFLILTLHPMVSVYSNHQTSVCPYCVPFGATTQHPRLYSKVGRCPQKACVCLGLGFLKNRTWVVDLGRGSLLRGNPRMQTEAAKIVTQGQEACLKRVNYWPGSCSGFL